MTYRATFDKNPLKEVYLGRENPSNTGRLSAMENLSLRRGSVRRGSDVCNKGILKRTLSEKIEGKVPRIMNEISEIKRNFENSLIHEHKSKQKLRLQNFSKKIHKQQNKSSLENRGETPFWHKKSINRILNEESPNEQFNIEKIATEGRDFGQNDEYQFKIPKKGNLNPFTHNSSQYGASHRQSAEIVRRSSLPKFSQPAHNPDDMTNHPKKKAFKNFIEEIKGKAYDEDYFLKSLMLDIENLDKWIYDTKKQDKIDQGNNTINTRNPQDSNKKKQKSVLPEINLDFQNTIMDDRQKLFIDNEKDYDKPAIRKAPNINEKYGQHVNVSKNSQLLTHETNMKLLEELIKLKLKTAKIDFFDDDEDDMDPLKNSCTEKLKGKLFIKELRQKAITKYVYKAIISKFSALKACAQNNHADVNNMIQNLKGKMYSKDLDSDGQFRKSSTSKDRFLGRTGNNFNINKNPSENWLRDFLHEEKVQLNHYNEIILEIHQRKHLMNTLSSQNFENTKKITQYKLTLQKMISQYDDEILIAETTEITLVKGKSIQNMDTINDLNNSRQDSSNYKNSPIQRSRKKVNLKEYIKINELKTKKETLSNQFSEMMNLINDQYNKNLTEISRLEDEVRDLKNRKYLYRYRQKEMYVYIVQNPEAQNYTQRSYVDILKTLFDINETVPDSVFPAYLDETSVYVQKEMAKKELLVSKTNSKSKNANAKLTESENHENRELRLVLDPLAERKTHDFKIKLSSQNNGKIHLEKEKYLMQTATNILQEASKKIHDMTNVVKTIKKPVKIIKKRIFTGNVKWEDLRPKEVEKLNNGTYDLETSCSSSSISENMLNESNDEDCSEFNNKKIDKKEGADCHSQKEHTPVVMSNPIDRKLTYFKFESNRCLKQKYVFFM